ncbi:TetR/AcrR family transcriptional regulator [Pseudomonas asiatica]|uniref:TetR/AcrR family transcriptional regulator n=1 Tax=Pseudomonas asiatica TaxID=2219225 RepID=UPI00383BF001
MSGVRSRQKELRRKAIIDCAASLFAEQGFAGTTVEQIAAEAVVSVATVFNYFGSKQQIVAEIIRDADEAAIVDALAGIDEFDDPLDALCYIDTQNILHTLNVLPVSVWRELLPLMFAPDTPFYEAYRSLVGSFMTHIRDLIDEMAKKGRWRPNVDPDICVQIWMDISHMQLFRLVAMDVPDIEGHKAYVRKAMTALLQDPR